MQTTALRPEASSGDGREGIVLLEQTSLPKQVHWLVQGALALLSTIPFGQCWRFKISCNPVAKAVPSIRLRRFCSLGRAKG